MAGGHVAALDLDLAFALTPLDRHRHANLLEIIKISGRVSGVQHPAEKIDPAMSLVRPRTSAIRTHPRFVRSSQAQREPHE